MRKNIPNNQKWSAADSVTSIRIIAAVGLFFIPLNTALYFAVYTLAGLTDALDGWLARKTGTAGEFGARLDSAADLLFYSALLIRIFPELYRLLPKTIWYAVGVILTVRLGAYAAAAVKYRRFASLHTILNKVTGFGVFLLPFVIAVSDGVIYSAALCIIAFAASFEELVIHLFNNDYRADMKSIAVFDLNMKKGKKDV